MTNTPPVLAPLGVRERYSAIYAGALTWNRYLQWSLAGAGLIIAGLVLVIFRLQAQVAMVKPVFIRIDELGRHDVLTYAEATTPNPRDHELRTAFRTFVVAHFSRMRSVVTRDFHESLYFLTPTLQDQAMRDTKKDIDAFLSSLQADEIDIVVRNVKLIELDAWPHTAEVVFDKQFYLAGTRQVRKPAETYTLHLAFDLADASPNEYLQVNPLGLRIAKMRLEQAFVQ
jgi:hypothetical protein